MAIRPEASRRVRIIGAGGTIAMGGDSATPQLAAAALVAAIPGLSDGAGIDAIDVVNKPSPT